MNSTNNNIIEIPLEFKVACSIYKIGIQEMLQAFINHVSVYNSLTEEYCEGFTEATSTISHFALEHKAAHVGAQAYTACMDLAAEHIKALWLIATNRRGKVSAKRKKCVPLIEALYKIAERKYAPSDTIYLDEETVLRLTKDFVVVCEIYGCYPKEFLENFMSRISLAETHAKKGLMRESNYTMGFFTSAVNGLGRDMERLVGISPEEFDFYDGMEEKRLELFGIRNLEKRTRILREFYLEHYQKMNALN